MTGEPDLARAVHLRSHGLGSVFTKTTRDSFRAVVVVAGLLSFLLFGFAAFFYETYPTPAARQELRDLMTNLPPALKGLSYGSGDAVNLDALGGYISQDPGLLLKLIPGLWSVLSLSATLAAEQSRGSLEFVATTAMTRRRIAMEKLAGHSAAMTLVMAAVAITAWLAGQLFARQSSDAIPAGAAVGYAVGLGINGLVAGSLAFAAATVIGRVAAAGLAGSVMFGGYLLNGYQASFPVFSGPARLTWSSWMAGHNPLAGQFDWSAVALVGLAATAMFAIGVESFARRDLAVGTDGAVHLPRLPDATAGLGGPVRRLLADRLPGAVAWGVGVGAYGLLIALSSPSFAAQLLGTPKVAATLGSLFPDYDITNTGGVLQATFMTFGYVLVGLAAAQSIEGWAADETLGRLEILLPSVLGRGQWVIAGGLAVYLALGVTTLLIAVGVGIGSAAADGDLHATATGTLVLGLYAVGLAGVGQAVVGLVGARFAGRAVAAVAGVTFLLDTLAAPLELPSWLHGFALSAHFGQPTTGQWNWTGVVASLVLALGGPLLARWSIDRRDIRR